MWSSYFLVLFRMVVIYHLITAADSKELRCNKSEIQLSELIGKVFNASELPPDLLPLTEKLVNTNSTLLLQNCSNVLTLKHYLYHYIVNSTKNDLPTSFYIALYTYVGMKYNIQRHAKYVPRTNVDIIFLTNSFATTNFKPVLERKVHLYFFHYGNWLEKLTHGNFSFDKYKNPRSLLLDIICELIDDPVYRVYEREVIFFLIVNNHVCPFIRKNYLEYLTTGYQKPKKVVHNSSSAMKNEFTQRPLGINRQLSRNSSSKSKKIVLYQNISIFILNDKIFPNNSLAKSRNQPELLLNFSFINGVELEGIQTRSFNITTLKTSKEPLEITTDTSLLPFAVESSTKTTETIALNRSYVTETKMLQNNSHLYHVVPKSNISSLISADSNENSTETTLSTIFLTKYLSNDNITVATPSTSLQRTEQTSAFNFSDILEHVSSDHHSNPHQYSYYDENNHEHNLSVWDVVEMDGPCREGQEHVVKLNVQSLLTAVDDHVANSSLELFRKLLNNVKAFPIEDYNARGELLRDLLPAISKDQVDPLIKKNMEDILDHVVLDGPGALPPKIKLECVDVPEENIKRIVRRTKRLFNLEFV